MTRKDKHYLILGTEFGTLEGRHFIFTWVFYGINPNGYFFREYIVSKLDGKGFDLTNSNSDSRLLWLTVFWDG